MGLGSVSMAVLKSDEHKQESHQRITEHSRSWEQSRSIVVNDEREELHVRKLVLFVLLIYLFMLPGADTGSRGEAGVFYWSE